jgi:hypothetical protein
MDKKVDNIVLLKTFPNRITAEIAKSALEAQRIESYIDADDAGGMYPFPLSGHTKGARLFIKKTDEKRAGLALDL